MPSVNPGPAITQTANTKLTVSPVNTTLNSNPQGANALRLLACARAIPVSSTGDAAVMNIINSVAYVITAIGVGNASANLATANLSVNAGPAVTGVSLSAPAALTTLTGPGIFALRTIVPGQLTGIQTAQQLYVNVSAATPGTVDIFVWGYDLS